VRLLRGLLRRLLFKLVRTHCHPAPPSNLPLDLEKPVCFVLADRSLSSRLVLEQEALRAGWLTAEQELAKPEPDELPERAWCPVHYRGGSRRWQRRQDRRLQNLLAAAEGQGEDPQIVPVAVFWGRAPETEHSVFQIMFSDAWRAPGAIRKLLMILLHGRQTLVYFGEPMSLRELTGGAEDRQRAARRVARILRAGFRRLHAAVIGPDLSHRYTLVNGIVRSTRVQQAIETEFRAGRRTREQLQNTARRYALEIAADYSFTLVRIMERLLTRLFQRMYSGIRLYRLDQLQRVAGECSVVLVPSHRSHLDYLLLSYVMYVNGLAPPHVASGINLNMPLIGPILRRGGAFFLRRSFKGNHLYSAVFHEYLGTMMRRGFPIEFFVEGGRSRTGRMLEPRFGMLAMTVTSLLQDQRRPVALVPVYFGYEKLLESSSYLSELLGREKRRETLGGLLRSLRRLRENYGEVHVSFGEPIRLGAVLDEVSPRWRSEGLDDVTLQQAVTSLGYTVVERINDAAVVNPINLLALCLLATRKRVMDERSLEQQIAFYVALLEASPYSGLTRVAERDPRRIVAQGLALGFIARHPHPMGDLIYADDLSAVQLTYFRNNVLHLMALPSLAASLFAQRRAFRRDQVTELVQLLYPGLRRELFLRWHDDAVDEPVQHILDALLAHGLLVSDTETSRLRAADGGTQEFLRLVTLAQAIAPHLQRYYLTIRLLVTRGPGVLDVDALEEQSQQLAERLSWLQEFNAPDFFDRKAIRASIRQLLDSGVLQLDEAGRVGFDERLRRADDQARYVLADDVRLGIIQLTAPSS
jgi:glycerol-3-phosphate O-acyltransferase